jgi:peptidoglycan/LPS O-acetylase OafA/YrhL
MRIKELDGLRGVAILAVINAHYFGWLPASGAAYGSLGVDLFFVRSGFLITSILFELREEKRYFSIFYSRRALRILPPYMLGLAVYVAVSFALGMPGTVSFWSRFIFFYGSLYVHGPFSGLGPWAKLPGIVTVVALAIAGRRNPDLLLADGWPGIRFGDRITHSPSEAVASGHDEGGSGI